MRRAPAPPPTRPPVPAVATSATGNAQPATTAQVGATAVAMHEVQPAAASISGQPDNASSSGRDSSSACRAQKSAVGAQGGEGKAVMGPPPAKTR